MYSRYILTSALLMLALKGYSQTDTASLDSIFKNETLHEVKVVARKAGTSRLAGAVNGIAVNKDELFKAACCNLGESFTTNPSVDVAYNDATTGARQIKLLGLSGTYVQMLTENLPNFRGAAIPYALGYVPGPWMKGIQVSKGSASVKNVYESITGQINVDYLQPEDEQKVEVNLFGDSKSRIEANADANVHLSDKWATEILLHHENILKNHDDNGDGFYDMPGREQYNVQNRWVYKGDKYIFHGGLGALKEIRTSGQDAEHVHNDDIYRIKLHTNRYEGYMKHAFILDHEHGTNIAFMSSASMHQLDAQYGNKFYDLNEKNLYGSLMFETNFSTQHNLSLGLSFNHDYLGQNLGKNEKETTPGAYAQYTYTLGTKLTAMAGVRFDHSSLYGNFFTPRFHVKYSPIDAISIRLSAGKGYRTVFALAEYNYLLSSGRNLNISKDLKQEEAWNYGLSTAFYIPMFGKTLKLNAEYYYTSFENQAVVDYDANKELIAIYNLRGKSYSHTFQIDASYPLLRGLEITAAYRLNDVKCTYDYGKSLMEKPLTSKYKALFTASYKTPLGLWQFDATVQLNGGGRNPEPYLLADGSQSWSPRFHSFEQVSAQVTRWFRHWSIYVGGENLTGFKQKTPIYGASNPWGRDFEPTLVWGPVEGRMFYAGVRVHF
ncbi:TonB-dependent receptor [Segatella copri]|uniref:TonB-dependent receptor plug domain-containing protein n=1 Tax=Segatella copri TaxID=165179 RepID=UPI002939D088|nr:TonB-dependent receptor [Segatella copri]MDV3107356.1 TonB-dependent receptor [Segatella copri]